MRRVNYQAGMPFLSVELFRNPHLSLRATAGSAAICRGRFDMTKKEGLDCRIASGNDKEEEVMSHPLSFPCE
jgi:hypothetical protein